MKRSVSVVEGNQRSILEITFKEGEMVIARFLFWNFIGYGDILTRAMYEFTVLGILPKEQDGFKKEE